ncbi:hypothetical protein C8Q76DRAFT_571817, partial [Earliella scabrosa]
CPHCDYVQKTSRKVDMKRHIASHKLEGLKQVWFCCGLPSEGAGAGGTPTDFESFSGGCGRVFTRKDSLQKHLRRKKGVCVGD